MTKRGTLKVYLGFAPGVGKTCAMLSEAHDLYDRGRDVLIGIVEDHGRERTRKLTEGCLLYTSPSPRDRQKSRMPSSA